jgi:hypothetical protein
MEDDDGQSRCPSSKMVPILVTPTAGEIGGSNEPIDTPVVALGDHHWDHSEDERSVLIDSLINLSCLRMITANESPVSTLKKKRTFPITKFIVDGNNIYSMDHIPITNVTLPLSKLIKFCQSSFKCRNCHSVLGKQVLYYRKIWNSFQSLF